MQAFLIVLAVIVTLAVALTLVFFLVRVILALQSITAKLANARLLLITASAQTEPAPGLIGAIGGNIAKLHSDVNGVARSLGLA